MDIRLHTIADICSKVGVLWWGLMDPKSAAMPLSFCSLKGCKSAGPQSPPPPGIEPGPTKDRRLLNKNAKKVAMNPKCQLFFDRQLWRTAVLQPLEIQGPVVPHLAVVRLGSQGRGSAFKVCHALLKSAILLHKLAIVCNLMSIAVAR